MDIPPTDKDNAAFLKVFEGFVAGALTFLVKALQLKVFSASLFNSPKHSDVTLYLGYQGMKFHAHLAILSVRTSYFDNADSFKTDDGKLEFCLDDKKLKIEENAHVLYRMLQYMYTGNYLIMPNQTDFDIQ